MDEPTTGLHPADVERLVVQLDRLVDAGNTIVLVYPDTRVIAGSDWVIEMGPGTGAECGPVVGQGTPATIMKFSDSRTGPHLAPGQRCGVSQSDGARKHPS